MDISTYKTLANVVGYALVVLPVGAFVNQMIGDRLKTREKQAIIKAIPGGPDKTLNREISDIDARSSRHSIINAILLGITLISGIALLVANGIIQESDEKNIEDIGNSQKTTNENEVIFEKKINAKVDLLSSRIRGNKKQTLTPPQREAFRTLESLSDKKICLVKVGSSNENSSFYDKVVDSIYSYDKNLVLLTMGTWENINIDVGHSATIDNHNEIQVFDPNGQSGAFYKAIEESGLPTNLIPNLPMACHGVDYGLVIGGN